MRVCGVEREIKYDSQFSGLRNYLQRKGTLEKEQFGKEDGEFRFGQIQSWKCLQDIPRGDTQQAVVLKGGDPKRSLGM